MRRKEGGRGRGERESVWTRASEWARERILLLVESCLNDKLNLIEEYWIILSCTILSERTEGLIVLTLEMIWVSSFCPSQVPWRTLESTAFNLVSSCCGLSVWSLRNSSWLSLTWILSFRHMMKTFWRNKRNMSVRLKGCFVESMWRETEPFDTFC